MTNEERDKNRHSSVPPETPAQESYNPYLWAGGMPTEIVDEGFTARAGSARDENAAFPTEEVVIAAMREVYDPELPVNIYDLGLIYETKIDDNGDVSITMTLTAPACPVAGEMPGMVARAVAAAEGVGHVAVTLTWDPPWDMSKMSEDAQLALGIF